ncbi:KamA family radical SAM protein [Geobacter pelophilus]|uniref:KamA family radical SAM protein n=1 Tax=Geoanaerobacter pelophilus TaxID=60036 RepID=A0AAW4LCY3_9BACT|nr:KamA family radical SAM protein [Geoanaerobacter pelophilus]MBT0666415.1 KamA family radical SAM protein [Geoanaerobacter pelophilus]
MSQWRNSLAAALATPEQLAEHFGTAPGPLQQVALRYPLRITPHYLSLIREPGDPIWRQCVPDPLELTDDQAADPLCEESLSPVPGLIHRYPDRVVWLVANECAVYCRFCMRKRQVGCGAASGTSDIAAVLAYISATPAIRDVILSGGDPLLLSDEQLEELLAGLRKIPHVEIIRIGTRVPVTLPERVTPELCSILRRFHPLYINTHFNHSQEITPESTRACGLLADAGIQLGNQTVLLKGVNDTPQVMKTLMTGLLKIRVRPYYIHQMDLVNGTGHFRTTVDCGIDIIGAIRGHISGLATPYYVIDLAGGKGKVPLLPEDVRREGDKLLLKNYMGEIVEYRNPLIT